MMLNAKVESSLRSMCIDTLIDCYRDRGRSDEAREWLAKNGFDSRYGARPMARLIHEKIKQPLAQEILFGKLTKGGSVSVTEKDGELQLNF